jgi:hypothetical protein
MGDTSNAPDSNDEHSTCGNAHLDKATTSLNTTPPLDGVNIAQNIQPDKENNKNNINCSKIMNKNKIRLTESQLHRAIKESVKTILNENLSEIRNKLLNQITNYCAEIQNNFFEHERFFDNCPHADCFDNLSWISYELDGCQSESDVDELENSIENYFDVCKMNGWDSPYVNGNGKNIYVKLIFIRRNINKFKEMGLCEIK